MSTPPTPPERVAGRLAQLLGDTILQHAPHTAKVNADETRRQVDDWLEGWERHSNQFVEPVVRLILENTDPPEAIRGLLLEAANPTAQFSATLMQIFLWGIISSVISRAIDPFLQEISNDLSTTAVGLGIKRPIDPATLATAAARGFDITGTSTVPIPADMYAEAAKSGVGSEELDLLGSIVGLPPALQELFELYRRGEIAISDVKQGLKEGDFRDDWIDRTVVLAHAWLTPLDFVRAAVQAQMTYSDARDWAFKTGLDNTTAVPIIPGGSEATPDMFGLAFSIAGRPPGPQELGRMALRKIIPWQGEGAGALTFQQGIAESDVKTKWTAALQALETYVPPPRTIGTLLEHGAITEDQAKAYWEDGGVTPELAAGYVYMTQQQHVGQDKLLAKGEVTTAYFDGIFTREQATAALDLLGFRGDVATEILELVDFRREIQAINSVIRKIGTLYQAFEISATNATTALVEVGVPVEQASNLLGTWDLIRVAPVRVPTPAEIGKAVKAGTITEQVGLEELAARGYQPRDAAIVLSSETGAPVTPLPPAGTTTTG